MVLSEHCSRDGPKTELRCNFRLENLRRRYEMNLLGLVARKKKSGLLRQHSVFLK